MTDFLTYVATFAGETAAVLPSKVYDPAAWLDLLGALLLGTIVGRATSSRSAGIFFALGYGVLAFTVLTLERAYRSPVTRGDSAALAIICLIGSVAGQRVALRLRRRSD
jgi:hypothetical protein